MTLEALQIIKGIWTHEIVQLRRAAISNVKTSSPASRWCRKPHPPLWMPTRSKDSIEEAASSGMSTVQWVPSGMKADAKSVRRIPRSVSENDNPSGRKPHMGLMREIYVAESDRQARAEGEFHWKNFWERRGGGRTYGAHGTDRFERRFSTAAGSQQLMNMEHSIAEGSFICGSPDNCRPANQDNCRRGRRRIHFSVSLLSVS